MKNNIHYPLYEKIIFYDLETLVKIFSHKHDLIVLHSSLLMPDYGRYSFLCFDAFASFRAKNKNFYWNNEPVELSDPFDFISSKIEQYKIQKDANLPPLQGGAVGYFGYEACHYLEDLCSVPDYIQLPDIYLGFYSNIIAIDHAQNSVWIIATGFPETECKTRALHAQQSILEIKQCIEKYLQSAVIIPSFNASVSSIPKANFSQKSYIHAVDKTKEYILAGDLFEANISQQFNATMHADVEPLDLYFKLNQHNPAPFSAFIKIPEHGYIVSASPERFVKLTEQFVETCPIKGTIKRAKNPYEDSELAKKLLTSEKDHAENVMIVDLMRNDFSKICLPKSVIVEELCALKSFVTVHHLVSKVTGKLKTNMLAMDVIKATFPAGSITGAPKIRAMQIISELEQQTRGPYCGCIGYFSFTGDMDTAVTIRTYFINHKQIYFSAGGAVVLDSSSEDEYLESLLKAKSLIEVLTI